VQKRKSVNNNLRVHVKRRSQNMFKPFKNVDPRIQRFIDGKLEALKLGVFLVALSSAGNQCLSPL
jgi:hypothetical protein